MMRRAPRPLCAALAAALVVLAAEAGAREAGRLRMIWYSHAKASELTCAGS